MSKSVRAVLDEYFDFDVNPWADHDAACPAPEDLWRLHRDLKAAIASDQEAHNRDLTAQEVEQVPEATRDHDWALLRTDRICRDCRRIEARR